MKKTLFFVLAMLLALPCFALAEEPMYISVISKGEQHAFWQAVRKGCEDAADEYGVNMHYYGPPTESDIDLQVKALNEELRKQPDALVLAALSTGSVMAQLEQCVELGIPVIGFDSGVPDAPAGSIRATASTNNRKAAAMVADEMLKLRGFPAALAAAAEDDPLVIGVLSQDAVSESITGRTTGFVNRMYDLASEYNTVRVEGHGMWNRAADGAGVIIRVVIADSPETADVTAAAASLLNDAGLYAVFCTNEGAVNGLLAATSSGADLADGARFENLVVAGFDAGSAQKNAVRNNWFAGSVTQDPYRIGYLAVELAVRAARGGEVGDVDTGAQWYTSANMDLPQIAFLVYD